MLFNDINNSIHDALGFLMDNNKRLTKWIMVMSHVYFHKYFIMEDILGWRCDCIYPNVISDDDFKAAVTWVLGRIREDIDKMEIYSKVLVDPTLSPEAHEMYLPGMRVRYTLAKNSDSALYNGALVLKIGYRKQDSGNKSDITCTAAEVLMDIVHEILSAKEKLNPMHMIALYEITTTANIIPEDLKKFILPLVEYKLTDETITEIKSRTFFDSYFFVNGGENLTPRVHTSTVLERIQDVLDKVNKIR